jgi:hypothetical protein
MVYHVSSVNRQQRRRGRRRGRVMMIREQMTAENEGNDDKMMRIDNSREQRLT